MKIGSVNSLYSFKANDNQVRKDQNPISKNGEKAKLVKATFVAGLGLGAKLLCELMDGDFIVEKLGEKADKIVEKQHKNANKDKKFFLKVGAGLGLLTAFVAGFAALYTLFKAPKINYQGNVNAFQKEKDMDVYIKGNTAEKELYTQMNEKAKNADEQEKAKLREQYLKMQVAKNKLPDFVNLKR